MQNEKLVLGIDEAGRGSVIGPLVIGGVMVKESKIRHLQRAGVKDSKKLTKKSRTVIARKLKKTTEFMTIIIPANEIDSQRKKDINLNQIETNNMKEIIRQMKPDKCFLDCIDVNEERFHDTIQKENKDMEIIAEHKADEKYLVVSAASIIAKVERDRQIAILQEEYGNFGSGYPSDENTINYIKDINDDFYPPIIRKTWKTFQNIKNNNSK